VQVVKVIEKGAFLVTNFYPGSCPLETEEGKPLQLVKWLKQRHARAGNVCSTTGYFQYDGKRYKVRVIAKRRTAEQTKEMIRRKKRKASSRVGGVKSMGAESLYLAGWLLVMTTLPATDWSAREVLCLYRARWHIELLFKRIKQLLDHHILRAKTEETARAQMLALLLAWVIQQDTSTLIREKLSEMYQEFEENRKGMMPTDEHLADIEELPLSEWHIQALGVDLLRQRVKGTWTEKYINSCLPQLYRHLRITSRKRPHRWQQTSRALTSPKEKTRLREAKASDGITSFDGNTALA
jgi:hypothetical protein